MGKRGRTRYKRKMYFDTEDRILLHLLQFVGYEEQVERPDDLTQFGVAAATGLGRSTVSKALRAIMGANLIFPERAHVPSGKLRRTTYLLTEEGVAAARRRKEEIEKELVVVTEENGTSRKLPLSEIARQIPVYASTAEIAVHVSEGVFDVASFVRERSGKTGFVDFTQRVPRPRYFYGRGEELRTIDEWLGKKKAKFLALVGIPGIGKTTLLVKRFEDWRRRTNLFWYRILDWSTLRNVLRSLADFLDRVGRRELLNYLATADEVDMEEVAHLLEKDLEGLDALLVFDDCHKSSEQVQRFFYTLKLALDAVNGPKVIVAGRRTPSFYDRRDVKVNDTVKEFEMRGLDSESSRKLLSVRHVDIRREEADRIHEATKGHPLFLELVDPARGTKTTDIRKYLEEDLISRLSRDELAVLSTASVFRYPVSPEALLVGQEADMGSLRSLVDQNLLREASLNSYEIHDLLKDFFKGRLAANRRRSLEIWAARHHMSLGTEEDYLEAVHHLFEAGEVDEAAELLATTGKDIARKGHTEELEAFLHRVAPAKLNRGTKLNLLLLRGEILTSMGEWGAAQEVLGAAVRMGEREQAEGERAAALRMLGDIYRHRKERGEALRVYKTSLSIYKTLGNAKGLAAVHYGLGTLYEEEGSPDKALKHLRRASRLVKMSGDTESNVRYLFAYSRVLESRGDKEKPLRLMKEALSLAERSGNLHEIARITISLGAVYNKRGQHREALTKYREGINLARRIGNQRLLAYGLLDSSSVLIVSRNHALAETSIAEAMKIFEKLGERTSLGLCEIHLGFVEDHRGQWQQAKRHLQTGLSLLRRDRSPEQLLDSLIAAGDMFARNGELREAAELYSQARSISKRLGRDDLVKHVNGMLAGMKGRTRPVSGRTPTRA